jgi:DNA-binding SARP family transcriptional activator
MRRTAARLGVIVLLAGVPVSLVAALGPPALPSFGPSSGLSSSYLPPETVLRILGLLTWALWGYLAFAILLHGFAIVTSLRGVGPHEALLTASSLLTPRLLRHLVEIAVSGTLLAASMSPRVAASGRHDVPVAAAVAYVSAASPDAADVATVSQQLARSYRVHSGDSLWKIAEQQLGSGFRWREIFDLNVNRRFPDGRNLINPNLIYPGWVLELPKGAGELIPPEQHRPPQERSAPPGGETRQIPEPTPTYMAPTEAGKPDRAPPPSEHGTERGRGQGDGEESPAARPSLSLPSGLVVAASFASGLLSAHLLGRLRRRRSRRLTASAQHEPQPPTDLIQDLRRAGASEMAGPLDIALDAVVDEWRQATGAWPTFLAAVEGRGHVSAILRPSEKAVPRNAGGALSPQIRFSRAGDTVLAEVGGPFPPRLRQARTLLERGVLVPLGRNPDGSVGHVSLTGLGQVSITGPKAGSVARQLVLAAAAQGGSDEFRLYVLGSGTEVERLSRLPQVSASAGWEDAAGALREIQLELIRRARLFFAETVEEIGGHLMHHSDERLPAVLVVVLEPPAALRGLVEALGREVPPLGAALLAVGWTPQDASLHVQAGPALELSTQFPSPKVLEPFILDAAAEEQAIDVIRDAFPVEAEEQVSNVPTEAPEDAVPPRAPLPLAEQVRVPASGPVSRLLPLPGESLEPPSDVPAVRCLGPLEISRAGNVLATGWKAKGRELLAYLVAHPAGAAKDRIIEELWPEIEPGQGAARFDRAASLIRSRARGTESGRMFLERVGESYRLERDAWWVDAWEFERLIDEARRSEDQVDSITKLRDAVALYRGEFCDDQYYSWAEPIRERYRGLLVEGSARLAHLLTEASEQVEALAVLDRAIEADPVCEDLTRRAMAIEAGLGRRAAALSRYKKIEAVLENELGVEPDPETQDLVRQLVHQRGTQPRGDSLISY